MLNISFLACTKVETDSLYCGKWRKISKSCHGLEFQSHAMTLTLVRQCPISNLSDILSYITMYSNFMSMDRLLFELLCKNTETQKYGNRL